MQINRWQTALLLGTVLAAPVASSAVLFAEDFSSGNPVSGTAYTLVDPAVYTAPGVNGRYRVVNNPGTTFTNGYTSYYDHTVGTAAGSMMFFDGATNGDNIYSRFATLAAGQSYTFTYWYASDDSTSRPTLQLTIGGVAVGSIVTSVSDGVWTSSTNTYVATASGATAFAIFDTNLVDEGNDGALDDISLIGPDATQPPPPSGAVPEPDELALLLFGSSLLFVARRQRRSRVA